MKRHAALIPLSRQHHAGLALGVMIERAQREDAGPARSAEIERVREHALDLWQAELRGHFEVEEQLVFPAAREAVEPAVIAALLAEHEEIRQQLTALESASLVDAEALLDRLRTVLVQHIRTEERVLFEAMQASLDQQQMEVLGSSVADALPAVCVTPGSAAL